ncbi:hypothetical protein SP5_098_00460 [Sphingomonas parapaucimobilis NBRC 15100]|uniref:Uncharacterized protein n=1 Tax=Sphingomonas parapaucimobilis NBRC 15100 TaxID=1219049 RepID=A0A0A1WCU6_9SPHN|nr:hypothetical protein SP5_098_00460 [Sphingomonas parapaucimobilis NBRC 15100]
MRGQGSGKGLGRYALADAPAKLNAWADRHALPAVAQYNGSSASLGHDPGALGPNDKRPRFARSADKPQTAITGNEPAGR